MTPLATALDYIARGWCPVPIPFQAKAPVAKGWQKLRIMEADAPRWFNGAAQNIGVILGAMSSDLVDADLDCREALALATSFLPPTDSVFGRAGKQRSHRLYTSSLSKRMEFTDPDDGEMLLELRSGGVQTVFPGSTHETGEEIEWSDNGDPAEVDHSQLVAAARRLAAACVLVRAAPAEGRHNYLLDVSGALVRGLGRDGAASILAPAARLILSGLYCKAAGDGLLDDTVRKLAHGEPVTGWPKLAERIGEKRARKISDWLGLQSHSSNGPPENRSHDALAEAWGASLNGTARHVAAWGRWFLFDGVRWAHDDRRAVWTMARKYLREIALSDGAKSSAKLQSADTIAAVVNLARSNADIAEGIAVWDSDPYLLGTRGGVVDLRTGKLRAARPEDYITKVTAVAPAPPGTPAPMWIVFLERIFLHAPELIPFIKRNLGYALTGEVKEQIVSFAWGEGGNGKGVLLNTACRILGDYAKVAGGDLLLASKSERHPCDMAALRGARLVTAQELGVNQTWDEPKLKRLTGGDPITARFMRQDEFTFEPQFTLIIAGNHKPTFKSPDKAIRRRMHLWPFLQNLPASERDPDLPNKLKAEWPAILRWMIDGCLEWQRDGLQPPGVVIDASDDYLDAEDTLGQWLGDRCKLGGAESTPFTQLFEDWKLWCAANGIDAWGGKTFSKALEERGLKRKRAGKERGFVGIQIAPKEPEEASAEAFRNAGRDPAASGSGRWTARF